VNNRIGGTAAGEGNTIAFSRSSGLQVTGGKGLAILGNSIFSNNGLGIDLDKDADLCKDFKLKERTKVLTTNL